MLVCGFSLHLGEFNVLCYIIVRLSIVLPNFHISMKHAKWQLRLSVSQTTPVEITGDFLFYTNCGHVILISAIPYWCMCID